MFSVLHVDLTSSLYLADIDVDRRCNNIIDLHWPIANREQAIRTGVNKETLDQFFKDLGTQKDIARFKYTLVAIRNLEHKLSDHRSAVAEEIRTVTEANAQPPFSTGDAPPMIPKDGFKEEVEILEQLHDKIIVRDRLAAVVGNIVADNAMIEVRRLADIEDANIRLSALQMKVDQAALDASMIVPV